MKDQSSQSRRSSELKTLIVAFSLLMTASTVLIAVLVYFSVRSQNEIAVRNSEHLVRSIVRDINKSMRDQLLYSTYWDDAVNFLVQERNADWADRSVGIHMHHRFGIDASYVVAPSGAVTYAMRDGRRIAVADPVAMYGEDFNLLLERARSTPDTAPPMPISGYVRSSDGGLYLTAMSVLTHFEPGNSADGKIGTGWVLVFQERIDPPFLESIGDRYLLNDLTFVENVAKAANARMAIVSPSGNPFGVLTWRVEPALADTMDWLAPFIAALFVVFGILAVLFFSRSRRILDLLARNLADVQEAQASRNQALIEARNASQAKSRFLANMSHELRTPLNAIIGMTDMMRHGVFGNIENDRYKGYLDDMYTSAGHLLRLINDVLDISTIEAGKLNLKMQLISVPQLVAEGLAVSRQAAANKGIDFECQIPDDLPEMVVDHRSLTQILVNLLNNAVKYTPQGGHVLLKVEADESAHTFTVRDTGIGIPPEKLPSITEPFTRAHDDPDLGIESTGLGLSITEELTTAHQGTLNIESEVGVGTTVSVRFPRVREDQFRLFDDTPN